jgi:cytosine/adenosine deaminase-related metal-dependent hydrolase
MRLLVGADWLITPEAEALKNGWVCIENGSVTGYHHSKPEGLFHKKVRFDGILMPGIVNAHTHLELSGIAFQPDKFHNFFEWLLWIVEQRNRLKREKIIEFYLHGIEELRNKGVAYVGDVSSFGISRELSTQKNGVYVHSFLEIIGKDAELTKLKPPFSIHAIYSVSFSLIKKIARLSTEGGYKFQIHLGETKEEERFAKCQKNLFEEVLYKSIGRTRYEKVCAKGVVDYLEKAQALCELTIAVHCTTLSTRELDVLMERGVSIVLCPRSNLHLKTGFPQVKHLLGYPKVGIGTDGFTSNVSLSVLEELKTLYYKSDCTLPLKELFKLATSGGATVLGIEDYRRKPIFTVAKPSAPVENPFTVLVQDGVELKVVDFSTGKV